MTMPSPNYVCNEGEWNGSGISCWACSAVGDAPTAAGHYPGSWIVVMVINGVQGFYQCPDGVTISYSGSMNVASNNAIQIS